MAHSDTGICYECDAECVGAVFCGFGGQDSPDVRLPKVLNVKIEANPAFWGFPGVLFSGDITYSSSKFDYWNQFEENWLVDKTCGNTTIRDLDNERRPDVKYRSVYDPDTGTITYSGNTEINELGGPSVYLIDRDATNFTDSASCDETDPDNVFRFHPENFGFGNKILFEEDIYKNISAAWRGADTGVPNFTFNENGLPDGAVVGQYAGNVTGVYRDTATDPFIHLQVQYTGGQASAIRNGQILYLNSTCANQAYESQYLPDGAYYLTKVTHNGSYTDCSLVGSVGTEDFSESLTSSTWTIAGSLDEQTCRSKRAHGVDYEKKCAELNYNYHADLGVVINNSRNRIHSNRTTRDKFGWTNTRSADDKPRRDYTYVSVQESGHGLLVKEEETDNVALVCETGIWNPTWDFIYTSGDDYYSAFKPEDLFSVSGYHSDAPSTLVNIGSGLILTCGCTSGEPLGLCDISTGCLPLGWSKYAVSSGMYPMYGRELPFYGPFYEVYEHDNAVRSWQQDNTIKARNQTCYTPLATLEVYPDCITQENEYEKCYGGTTNLLNHVSRLAFVYRCFDYQEPCSYYESGLPYSGVPTNIDQLRQGLAGQEVYMYLNFGDAWAGEISRDPCGCLPPVPPGNRAPDMMHISSPVTFPCFPKFDIDPSLYGADDQIWKRAAANYLGLEESSGCACPAPATGDYSFAQQPYTTYGFIRNVCGKETVSSKAVIRTLNDINTGNYRNTAPNDDTVEPMYWEFPVTSGDLGGTPVVWNSGLSGGFVNGSGTLATWGIVDGNNRLIAPYYPVTTGVKYSFCDSESIDTEYLGFDDKAAFRGEWPKDEVPFLITIDHENNCSSCGTTVISQEKELQVTLTSLDGTYYHNNNYKYGFNDCAYNLGFHEELGWSCTTGWASGDACASTGDFAPYTSGTCDCLNGETYQMSGIPFTGSDITKYIASINPNNPLNSFVPMSGCQIPASLGFEDSTAWSDPSQVGKIPPDTTAYVSIIMSCNGVPYNNTIDCAMIDPDYYNALMSFAPGSSFSNPLSSIFGCGDCSHSYPSVNSTPSLYVHYLSVNNKHISLFEKLTTEQVYIGLSQGWLCNGVSARLISATEEGYPCGGTTPISTGCYTSSDETNHNLGCVGATSGVIFGNTSLPGCDGSVIKIYGCLLLDSPQSNMPCACGFYTPHFASSGGDNCSLSSGDYCGEITADTNYYSTGCYTEDCNNNRIYTVNGIQIPDYDIEDVAFEYPPVCGCQCIGALDELAQMTYHDSYDFGSGVTLNNVWVVDYHNCPGSVEVPLVQTCGTTAPLTTAISGANLPYVGSFGPIPYMGGAFTGPIACSFGTTRPSPQCEWKDDVDPNNFTYVDHKINHPGRHREVYDDSPCGELWPNYCDAQWATCNRDSSAYKSTCLTPVYGDNSIKVRRKRAYPEIMTVHKIDCLGDGSGYNLHVSREYHTHSRRWLYPIDGYTCDTYMGAVNGGGYNWRRSYIGAGKGPCPSFYFHPCSGADLNEFTQVWPAVDTGDPNYNLEGPFSSYYLLPHSVPSDQVTPAYPTINNSAISTSQSLCSYHPHSGSSPNHSVTRDFRYTIKPYNAKWEEYVQVFVSGDSGAVPQQLPLYTGVIDPPDTGVYGDYCDVTSNTGELVNIWIPRGKVFLDSDIENGLQDAESGVYTAEFGEFSCSGIGWAIAGPALKQYDYGNQIRYFAADALATSQCDTNQRYPDLSGVTLWNYYNLFYGSGDPDNRFYNDVELIIPDEEGDCNDPGRQRPPWNFYPTQGGPPGNTDDPHFGSIYNAATGIPINRRHSCIQDSTQCGGELWNNKMFFPRKPYEAGTRVTAFGALSLCTQDTTYETASWLEGYEDLSTNGTPDILREALQTRFIDACDTDAHSVTLQSSAGIDDVIIHVSDYLPLLGMYFVDRKMNLGDYTCLQPDSGCYDFLPIHSDQTLDKMSFVPAKTWSNDKEVSFGYYLDKLVTDAQDQCLFKPFKVMVDVDCCADTIRKIGQEDDIYSPTYLNWVDTEVPSLTCRAIGGSRPCSSGCGFTECGDSKLHEVAIANTCCKYYNIVPLTEVSGFCEFTPASGSCFKYPGCGGVDICVNYSEGSPQVAIAGPDYMPTYVGSGDIYTTPTFVSCYDGGSGLIPTCTSSSKTPIEIWNVCDTLCKITSSGVVGGYACGDAIYVKLLPGDSSCCIHGDPTVCTLLSSSTKIPGYDQCAMQNLTNNSADFINCECGTKLQEDYVTKCNEKQNILITISEV